MRSHSGPHRTRCPSEAHSVFGFREPSIRPHGDGPREGDPTMVRLGLDAVPASGEPFGEAEGRR
jgi:hypothetical protein